MAARVEVPVLVEPHSFNFGTTLLHGTGGRRVVAVAVTPVAAAARHADEVLCARLGGAPGDRASSKSALSAAHVAALTPAAAARLAFLLCDARTPPQLRVNVACTLARHAAAASRVQLLAPHVLDALFAVAQDCAFSDAAAPPLRVPDSVARAQAADGGGAPSASSVVTPELFGALLRAHVSPGLATAEDAAAMVRVFAVVTALQVINSLLDDALLEPDTRAHEEHKARRFALAAQLRKRGVVAAAATLADPASWAPSGVAAPPPAVAELLRDGGVTAAFYMLTTLQLCMLQGAADEARTTAVALHVALRVGAAAPPRSIERALSACLLSYSAVSLQDKQAAVAAGALPWLVQAAGADDAFTPLVRARALAGAGNIVRGAQVAAQLAPLLDLLLRLLRPQASRGFGALRRDEDALELPYNAVFVIGQLANFVELRSWVAQHDVEALLRRLATHARGPALSGIRALIELQALPLLLAPAPVHLSGAPAVDLGVPVISQQWRSFAHPDQAAPMPAPVRPDRCAACGVAARSGAPLKRCARCLDVWYCGAACQHRHWRVHKLACRPKSEE